MNRSPITKLFKNLVLIGSPILAIIFLMGLYNYVRFDSILEFGFKYQLRGEDVNGVPLYSFRRIPLDIFVYLFHPFNLDLNFPFFHPTAPIKPVGLISKIWFTDVSMGWYWYPINWLLLVPFFVGGKSLNIDKIVNSTIKIFLIVSAISMISVMIVHGECLRYMLDFTPIFLVATIIYYAVSSPKIYSDVSMLNGSIRYFYFLTFISCLISLGISITGTYDVGVLKIKNPELFNYLRSFFVAH
jgi:hypothetical protein